MRAAMTVCFTLAVVCKSLWANEPPNTPFATSPVIDGQVVSPADVHMECLPFSDPDLGNTHTCTTWEIWTADPPERVWLADCMVGVERVHVHLGDGRFENSHTDRTDLMFDTAYRLQVRHCDSSGDPNTEWSVWGERLFQTAAPTETLPLNLDDVLDSQAPSWVTMTGTSIGVPPAAVPPFLRLETGAGEALVEIQVLDGATNQVVNWPALAEHTPVRLRLSAGGRESEWAVPESNLTLTGGDGRPHTLYLPAASVSPGVEVLYWVDANGATYLALASQTTPDFSTPVRDATVPWTVLQAGFLVEVVATGLQLPVNIAFVPNRDPNANGPLFYVSELYGTIKAVYPDGTMGDYATGLLNFDPTGNFPGSGEQGLTGLVVQPDTGDVFASLLYDAGGDHYPMVLRFTSTDGSNTAAGQTVVLDLFGEIQGESHQISNLSFGPDGKLYVHMGDGFDTSAGQNLDSFRGKILRVNVDGTPPEDNPFYDAGDGIIARDFVYAYGFRNPFGGAWRAADGFHYGVENGPDVDRFAQIVPGRNYLWDRSSASMYSYALYNWAPAHAPANIAFVEPETFGGSGFPTGKMGHAFVSKSGPTYASGPQLNGKRISEFVLDSAGTLVDGPTPLIEYSGAGKATVIALAAGPVYFSDFYRDLHYTSPIDPEARILRVHFTRIPGDLNCDGVISFADINAFVLALSDASAYAAQDPHCDVMLADCNGDAVVSFADVNPFVALVTGQ